MKRPSGRSEFPTMVVVDESPKLPLFDGGRDFEERHEQVGENGVAIEEVIEELAMNGVELETFVEERRYPTRERRPLEE